MGQRPEHVNIIPNLSTGHRRIQLLAQVPLQPPPLPHPYASENRHHWNEYVNFCT